MHSSIIVGIVACLVTQAPPDSKSDSDAEQLQIQRWMEVYTQIAKQYRIVVHSKRDEELQLEPQMLLKYTNPVRTAQQHGALYAWSFRGRPEVIGSFWSKTLPDATRRRIAHEFHSLSEHALHAERESQVIWKPELAGIEPTGLPGMGEPAASQAARQIQMRAIARDCTAWILNKDEAPNEQLRLLPQPLLRYESLSRGIVDGALFAFVLGTDPELILQVEAITELSGKPKWQFSAARLTYVPLQLRCREAVIWKAPAIKPGGADAVYFLNSQVEIRDAIIPAD